MKKKNNISCIEDVNYWMRLQDHSFSRDVKNW